MKAKLTLAIVICALLSVSALPLLAQTADKPMVVKYIRMAYNGRSSTGTDSVSALVYVRDAANRKVVGATVDVLWTVTNLDGEVVYQDTATAVTTKYGYARLKLWEGKGIYTLTVTNVTKSGYVWDQVSALTTASIAAR